MADVHGTPPEDESWLASDGTLRVELSRGRWIRIKDELTYWEDRKLLSAGIERGFNGQVLDQDLGVYGLAKIRMWVVDWNARGRNGEPLDLNEPESFQDLSESQGEEILDAIRAHEAVLAERKNQRRTATKS